MKNYSLKILDNIYYLVFLQDNDVKKVNLNTKNFVIAKDRAKRYLEELQTI